MKILIALVTWIATTLQWIKRNDGFIVVADDQRSGSKGNTTYSRNKGGAYARARATPTNPNTSRQQASRSIFGTQSSAWNTLTTGQRAQWDTYAETHTIKNALGQDIHISGMAWYIKLNSRLVDAGDAANATPPPTTANPALASLAVTFTDADTLSVAFTDVISGTARIQLWQTPPHTQGSSPNFNQSRLVGYSPAGQATPWTAESPFAMLDTQMSIFFAKVLDSYGQVSAALEDSEIYSAV